MARKQSSFFATDGRDKGKRFLLEEMSAARSEEWATRALFAAMSCGIDVPDEILASGFAGVASLGIKSLSKVPYELAKPLFDEMMTCVQYEFEPGKPGGARTLIDDDIEEVSTRLKLRKAVLMLHMDSFIAAAQSVQALGAADLSGA